MLSSIFRKATTTATASRFINPTVKQSTTPTKSIFSPNKSHNVWVISQHGIKTIPFSKSQPPTNISKQFTHKPTPSPFNKNATSQIIQSPTPTLHQHSMINTQQCATIQTLHTPKSASPQKLTLTKTGLIGTTLGLLSVYSARLSSIAPLQATNTNDNNDKPFTIHSLTGTSPLTSAHRYHFEPHHLFPTLPTTSDLTGQENVDISPTPVTTSKYSIKPKLPHDNEDTRPTMWGLSYTEMPPDVKRVLLVGDIHACYDELITMLENVNYNPHTDILISVGDIIGKGPKGTQVLDFFYNLQRYVVENIDNNNNNNDLKIKGDSLDTEFSNHIDKMSQVDPFWFKSFYTRVKLTHYFDTHQELTGDINVGLAHHKHKYKHHHHHHDHNNDKRPNRHGHVHRHDNKHHKDNESDTTTPTEGSTPTITTKSSNTNHIIVYDPIKDNPSSCNTCGIDYDEQKNHPVHHHHHEHRSDSESDSSSDDEIFLHNRKKKHHDIKHCYFNHRRRRHHHHHHHDGHLHLDQHTLIPATTHLLTQAKVNKVPGLRALLTPKVAKYITKHSLATGIVPRYLDNAFKLHNNSRVFVLTGNHEQYVVDYVNYLYTNALLPEESSLPSPTHTDVGKDLFTLTPQQLQQRSNEIEQPHLLKKYLSDRVKELSPKKLRKDDAKKVKWVEFYKKNAIQAQTRFQWLQAMPQYLYLPQINVVAVHAGAPPDFVQLYPFARPGSLSTKNQTDPDDDKPVDHKHADESAPCLNGLCPTPYAKSYSDYIPTSLLPTQIEYMTRMLYHTNRGKFLNLRSVESLSPNKVDKILSKMETKYNKIIGKIDYLEGSSHRHKHKHSHKHHKHKKHSDDGKDSDDNNDQSNKDLTKSKQEKKSKSFFEKVQRKYNKFVAKISNFGNSHYHKHHHNHRGPNIDPRLYHKYALLKPLRTTFDLKTGHKPPAMAWAKVYSSRILNHKFAHPEDYSVYPHVVFGHDAFTSLQLEPYATGLDTGCCYGRYLTGLMFHVDTTKPSHRWEPMVDEQMLQSITNQNNPTVTNSNAVVDSNVPVTVTNGDSNGNYDTTPIVVKYAGNPQPTLDPLPYIPNQYPCQQNHITVPLDYRYSTSVQQPILLQVKSTMPSVFD